MVAAYKRVWRAATTWGMIRCMEPKADDRVTYFARTNFRNQRTLFGLRQADRRFHVYILGKTGTGKSTLLETFIRQDIANRQGLALFDPHGDLVERIWTGLSGEFRRQVINFSPADAALPLGYNPLDAVGPGRRALAASFLLDAFKKIWVDSWGPRLEHILRHALLALLDQPEATLADVLRLLDNPAFRRTVASRITNPQVRAFWTREFEDYPARFRAEAIAPIQNKVGAFLAQPALQAILTQPRSALRWREVMDEGQVVLVNLAKGKLGEDGAALLGALLVSGAGLAALSRADLPEVERRDFTLFLDEFQTYTTGTLATMLAELRKYRVSLVLAHQHLAQLSLEVREAILGNAGTMICFRIGAEDAEVMEREFRPEFAAGDLVSLPNYQVYLKMMMNGAVSRPFSAEALTSHLSERTGNARDERVNCA